MVLIPDPEDQPQKTTWKKIGGEGPVDLSVLSSEQKQKVINAIESDAVEFFIIATDNLKNLILKGHPIASQLPKVWAATFLEGKGIRIEKSLVKFWVQGSLDYRNAFILNNCEIRVEGSLSKIVESKTNKSLGDS